jgi:hypothetical protein
VAPGLVSHIESSFYGNPVKHSECVPGKTVSPMGEEVPNAGCMSPHGAEAGKTTAAAEVAQRLLRETGR